MKIILFDLGDTLVSNNRLISGALSTLRRIHAMCTAPNVSASLGLVSDYLMPQQPEDIPVLTEQYYQILQDVGIRSFFDPLAKHVTLSTAVGVLKPDRRIFRAAIRKANSRSTFSDALFITENLGHVVAARNLGMHAIHYKGPGQTTGDIKRLTELVPIVHDFIRSV